MKNARVNAENILFQIAELDGAQDFERIGISVRSSMGEIVIYEDGMRMPDMREYLKEIFSASRVELNVSLGRGNYKSVGSTCI